MSEGASDRDVEILAEALRLPPGERAEYLKRACGEDAELLRKLEGLARAHDKAGGFLDEPASTVAKKRATKKQAGANKDWAR